LTVNDAVSSMSGGSLTTSQWEQIGYKGTGSFSQTGGTNAPVGLQLGVLTGDNGSYSLSGSGLLSCGGEGIGSDGVGNFIATGGTNTCSGLGLGVYGNGTYNLAGSAVLSATGEWVGFYGTGNFVQSGGTNSVSGPLYLGQYAGSSGTYNLSGGVLILPALIQGSGAAVFNFSGGTLQAGSAFSTTLPMTLAASGGGATFDTAGYAITLSGLLSDDGGLTKAGSGTLTLAAANTYSGNTLIRGGQIALASPLALQNSTLDTSGSGTLSFGTLSTASFGGLSGPGSLSLLNSSSSAVALSVGSNGASTTFSGALTGAGSLIKVGSGALVLTGSNTYIGSTTANSGILMLDFSAIDTPSSNIINNSANNSALVFGGGTVTIQGNAGAANSQQFNGLQINCGASALQAVSGSGGAVGVNLGPIARNAGGTIDFTLPASGGIATTTASNGPGVLVDNNGTAYATVNGGSTFATISGGQIVGLTTYSNTNSFLNATSQTLVTSSMSSSGTTGVVAFSGSNITLTLTGNNDIDAGGILVSPAAMGTVITGGSLHAGGGNEVVIMNYGSLNVASAIVDNEAGTSLTLSGPGITTLTGTNTYTGTTYINNGATLQVGGAGNSRMLESGNITNNGTLLFSRSDSGLAVGAAISGNGGLQQNGSGMVALLGSNTYTGPTVIGSGTLQIGNGTVDGSIASSSNITDNAVLVYDVAGSQSYGNNISGTGGLCKTGSGTLTLTGSNSYIGGTSVNNGSLVGDTTSLQGAIIVANNVNVTFNQNLNGTYSDEITGNGGLTKSGSGTLLLSGSNTYAGSTTISAGTLQVGDGSVSGTLGSGNVTNNGALVFNRSDSGFSVSTAISGSGGLLQNGS
ncbi:MAG: autotransporter-associated beta strand repeat-containing protein, partial [Thermoguttaceae bacterium]